MDWEKTELAHQNVGLSFMYTTVHTYVWVAHQLHHSWLTHST